MHLAYSALSLPEKSNRYKARYAGYRAACNKHRDTIAAIQKYMPGWQPGFNQNNDQQLSVAINHQY